LDNSHYLCWEGQQFLLKLPRYFTAAQQNPGLQPAPPDLDTRQSLKGSSIQQLT